MFHHNKKHLEMSLFGSGVPLNATRTLLLERNWSSQFYENIFRTIDEKPFEALYCNGNGRPNFPVNILVGLEIIKEMFSITDEQLCENYHFNFLYQKALGVEEDPNEFSFSIRTLYNFRAALAEYESTTGKDLYSAIFKEGLR